MGSDLRRERLQAATVAQLAGERGISVAVQQYRAAVSTYPDAVHVLEQADALAVEHIAVLQSYLGDAEAPAASGNGYSDVVLRLIQDAAAAARLPCGALQAGHALLASAVVSYGGLFELALRLYEPPLRQLSTRCIKEYAGLAAALAGLVPFAVAQELQRDDLGCHCICPMCGIGACGCVELARQTLDAAWRPPDADEAPTGFPLQAPRPGSPMADAGVQAGERLFAIDGVPAGGLAQIQAAIRKHPLGDSVRMLVGRDEETAREVQVRHVSDYPGG